MMRGSMLLAVTVALAAGCATAAGAPFWQKTWRFGSITGNPQAVAGVRGTGADRLVLAVDRIDDPLGDGCPAGVSYADLRHRSRAELARHIGPMWKLPVTIERAGSVSGWVRCGRENVAAVAFVDGREGYRFFEDGLVVTLR